MLNRVRGAGSVRTRRARRGPPGATGGQNVGFLGTKENALGRAHLFASACSVCVGLTAATGVALPQAANPPTTAGVSVAATPGKAVSEGVTAYRSGKYDDAARHFA